MEIQEKKHIKRKISDGSWEDAISPGPKAKRSGLSSESSQCPISRHIRHSVGLEQFVDLAPKDGRTGAKAPVINITGSDYSCRKHQMLGRKLLLL